jgi:hypothetical protein
MKIFKYTLLVFSFLIGSTISACGQTYVVAPTGSDKNPGTSKLPFKTIQKCATLAKPGTTCLIRSGVYRETIRPSFSGTSEEPVTFAAYKNEKVTISGTKTVDNWTPFRDSIFRTQVTLPINNYQDTGFLANQLFVNGKMMPEARWPNTGTDFLRPQLGECCVKSLGGNTAKIENSYIPNLSEGWKDAMVWTNEWYVTRTGKITSDNPKNLIAQMTAPWDRGGYWFYLFGKLELLDSPTEWFYDGKQKSLYLWDPNSTSPKSVEVKQRNFAFDLRDRSYISLRNLNLFANTITTSDTSQGIVIDGIRAKYVSHHMTLPPLPKSEQQPNTDSPIVSSHAHDTGIQLRGKGHTLKNSIIEWSSGNGVLLEGTNHLIQNNVIANSNYMVSYAAPVRINGTGHRIMNNTIDGAGRDAINIDWHTAGLDGQNIEIAYNDISRFGMLSTDLGAIYTCCYINLKGGSIHHNWIRDAKAFSAFWGTRGIYLDIESYNSTIHHNVVWNIDGGQDSFHFVADSPRGYNRVFNNTFLGSVPPNVGSVEARNNIFGQSSANKDDYESNNLFLDTIPSISKNNADYPNPILKFTLQPDSLAIDKGVVIPGITEDFIGDAPDIGAYEKGVPIWKAGSTLEYTPQKN